MNKLNEYRNKIDLIDKELLRLLSDRLTIVKKVWEFKKENNLSALQSNRWNEVLESKKNIWKDLWLREEFVEIIWNNIHDEALYIENNILWD